MKGEREPDMEGGDVTSGATLAGEKNIRVIPGKSWFSFTRTRRSAAFFPGSGE